MESQCVTLHHCMRICDQQKHKKEEQKVTTTQGAGLLIMSDSTLRHYCAQQRLLEVTSTRETWQQSTTANQVWQMSQPFIDRNHKSHGET